MKEEELDEDIEDNDPNYWICNMPSARKGVMSVKPDTTLSELVTRMEMNNYSQVPVMTGKRDVKGVVTWRRIGAALALGKAAGHARDYMIRPTRVFEKRSIFHVLPIIKLNGYALVRDSTKEIRGIITDHDVTAWFEGVAKPFVFLEEIEKCLRRIIEENFSLEELRLDATVIARSISGVSDLTFGEYQQVLQNPDTWSKIPTRVDRAAFCERLEQVRMIRNDVMHFRPDGIDEEKVEVLRKFAHFLSPPLVSSKGSHFS